jgi:fructuronate reductase
MRRIVHIGVGAFFRAHQAWYTAKATDKADWQIIGFTGRSPDISEVLGAQDYKYTLITRDANGDSLETIDVLHAVYPADSEKFFELIEDEETVIVSLTITEAGYNVDESELNTSALGRLAKALKNRFEKTETPLAIVPCDNLPGNGDKVKLALSRFSSALGPNYAKHLNEQVDFVSTSVDRITPKTTDAELKLVREAGLRDSSPVVTEPFTSWVLKGEFRSGRPHWEEAGALFVDKLAAYETRKLWLLNGAHTLLANLGLILGLKTISEAVSNAACRAALFSWWDAATKELDDLPGQQEYLNQLLSRFENPRIQHNLSQIATDSLTKLSVRIAPVALAELRTKSVSSGVLLALAAWVTNQLSGATFPDSRTEEIREALASENPISSLLRLISPSLAEEEFADQIRAEVELLRQLSIAVLVK